MLKNYKKLLFGFSFLLLAGTIHRGIAQTNQDAVSIKVTLNHSDWKYKVGEKAIFSIEVFQKGQLIKNVPLHLEIGKEKMKPSIVENFSTTNNKKIINGGTLLEPGFLRCVVTATIDGKKYRALATAAFSPENIKAFAKTPDDFLTFWADARKEQLKIPLDRKMILLPERCDSLINVYEVSVQNNRSGSRIYGILCVPRKPGQYPALLKVPGAGARPYYGDTALAHKGIITFEIGIHGVTVTQPNQFYYDLAFGPLYNYYFQNLDNRDTYYYNRVYLGCLRAVDLLASLPEVDTSRIAVYGGSQGGALSIVTAALDHRIKYIAAFYFALSDVTGYLHGRAGGWPHMFSPDNIKSMGSKEKIKVSAYYDVANFAKLINIPGIYGWGFNDEVCPPTSIYAAYNNIHAPKETVITKESGHWLTAEEASKSTAWLMQKLQAK
ncbi:acetylxylan esterase [Hanamia caeni]|uniref:Acetylxylan esterase n=1 Tax=Hanamia caeni TaxID=2294116 RepID=A0A3M9ND91_9BACT|nr:acetylxylan esterase [Hanamia caeni]RNI35792.1 acetylxylan esterase [Hanamia caeni]